MKLEEILALHPKGADATTLRGAIGKAEALRTDLRGRAAELDRTRAEGLLTLEEKTILRAEEDAAKFRLAADRIDALLPAIRADLHAAVGKEALALLKAEVEAAHEAVAAVGRWQREEWTGLPPQLRAVMHAGTEAETAAIAAVESARRSIEAAYARQEVRDAGPLDMELPVLTGTLPSQIQSMIWRLL